MVRAHPALFKTGRSWLTQNGINTYSGATTVNNGYLNVNNQLTNSPVTVQNLGTLAGSGTIGQNVIVSSATGLTGIDGTPTILGSLTATGSATWYASGSVNEA